MFRSPRGNQCLTVLVPQLHGSCCCGAAALWAPDVVRQGEEGAAMEDSGKDSHIQFTGVRQTHNNYNIYNIFMMMMMKAQKV